MARFGLRGANHALTLLLVMVSTAGCFRWGLGSGLGLGMAGRRLRRRVLRIGTTTLRGGGIRGHASHERPLVNTLPREAR